MLKIYKGNTKPKINNKADFINCLKEKIREKCSKCADLDIEYESDKQEGKKSIAKTVAKPVMLLHNVQTIINQNASIVEEKKYAVPDFIRFPFHLYKKEGWDVEHIRPNSLEDYKGDTKKTARKKYIYVLEQYQEQYVKDALDKFSKYEGTEEEKFEKLWNSINGDNNNGELSEAQKNKIWNYVLLDASTNREYGNACFAIKREYVLKKEKGIKPELRIENDNVVPFERKEAAFVPICTRNVFSKALYEIGNSFSFPSKSINARNWFSGECVIVCFILSIMYLRIFALSPLKYSTSCSSEKS